MRRPARQQRRATSSTCTSTYGGREGQRFAFCIPRFAFRASHSAFRASFSMGGTYVGWVSYSISLDSHDHGVRGTSKKGKGQVVEAYSIY